MTLNLNQMIAIVFIAVLCSVIAFYEQRQKKREERYLRDVEKHALEIKHLKQQYELLKVKQSKFDDLDERYRFLVSENRNLHTSEIESNTKIENYKSKIEELEKAIKSNKINLTRNYNKLKKRDAKIKALEQSG